MIDLYSAATPNGHKVSIMLEETGLPYTLHRIDLGKGEQKAPGFLARNPNGRIPTIVDRDAGNFAVFESGAILIYLADKTGQLLPTDTKGRSVALQWLMLQMSGIGPMMGQAVVFKQYFPEKLPSVIQRFENECQRLFGVLDTRLSEVDYLAGDYSIADIATWPWVRLHERLGLDIAAYAHLQRWIDAIAARPAAQRGLEQPPMLSDEDRIRIAKTIVVR